MSYFKELPYGTFYKGTFVINVILSDTHSRVEIKNLICIEYTYIDHIIRLGRYL